MSPVVCEDTDFVFVGRMQSLVDMQDGMRTDLQSLRTRLACLEIRMTSIERESQINMHMRRVMLSFAAAATPVLFSVMLDQNLPPIQTPIIDFVSALSKIMLAFAACVGIPLLLQALTDLQEARLHFAPVRSRIPALAARILDDSQDSQDSEEEEDEEETEHNLDEVEE